MAVTCVLGYLHLQQSKTPGNISGQAFLIIDISWLIIDLWSGSHPEEKLSADTQFVQLVPSAHHCCVVDILQIICSLWQCLA